MDQTAAAIRRAQGEQIVLEANNSAIPKNAWCKQNGIKEKAFYYWQRKFRKEAAASAESAPAAAVPAAKSAFVELTVPAAPAETASSVQEPFQKEFIPEILLQVGDCRLFITGAVRKQTLNTVMQVIRNA